MLVAFLAMTYGRGEIEPYDMDEPAPEAEISPRSRVAALALAFFGGFFGLHRFYAGKVGTGLLMICTVGGLGLWWLYDLVLIASGDFRDGDGRPIRNWEGGGGRTSAGGGRRLLHLTEQVDRLEREVAELAERLDFAERMLAQHRDRMPKP